MVTAVYGDCSKPRVNSNILLGCWLVLGLVYLPHGPCQTEFHSAWFLGTSGIKFQLLCGIRMGPA